MDLYDKKYEVCLISIINLGLSNIASVSRMISCIGGESEFVDSPEQILNAKKLILPGVGHFDAGMACLRDKSMLNALYKKVILQNTPILGICLGMQMLCVESEEGQSLGMGFVDARVAKFQFSNEQKLKVPHMGWNDICVVKDSSLFLKLRCEQRFYFVHSYYVIPKINDIVSATANYGFDFCAAFEFKNILGVQFHPEKSHRFGMSIMKRFLEIR